MSTPKKNVAYTCYLSLIDSMSPGTFKANPTLAVGDFKISIDGGEFANLATLPVVKPSGSIVVKVSLSATEMNGAKIVVQCIDVAGGEWNDLLVFIDTDVVNMEDIVRSTTPANTLNVSAGGLADADVQQLGGSATALATMAALYDGAVARGTVGSTVTDSGDFTIVCADLSANDFDYDNMWFVMLDGNNKFVPRLIGIYTDTAGTKRVQFTGAGMAGAFPQTVVTGDAWMIISGSL
jgi:hypothetical protein